MRVQTGARARWLVAMALLPSAVACGSGTAERASESTSTRIAQPTPEPARSADPSELRPAREQVARFAVLRTPPEGLPASVRSILRLPIGGLSPERAQRVPGPAPGEHWLVPGTDHLCIVARVPAIEGVGTVCARTADALSNGVANISLNRQAGTRLIVGVAPDGTRAVLVHTHGSVVRVPVVAGRFVLRDSVVAPADRLVLR